VQDSLIREMHARLLRGGRGGTKSPGEFRTSQNWVGGTRPGKAREQTGLTAPTINNAFSELQRSASSKRLLADSGDVCTPTKPMSTY
jgi:hypothetical protein